LVRCEEVNHTGGPATTIFWQEGKCSAGWVGEVEVARASTWRMRELGMGKKYRD